ncbi:hypothetical protein C3B79_1396 [Aeromonas hydrophila]|nr:hypothetical protein C3B79_1396 [Aeromonas hydrophila]
MRRLLMVWLVDDVILIALLVYEGYLPYFMFNTGTKMKK